MNVYIFILFPPFALFIIILTIFVCSNSKRHYLTMCLIFNVIENRLGSFDRGPPVQKPKPPTDRQGAKPDGPAVVPVQVLWILFLVVHHYSMCKCEKGVFPV